MALPRVWSRLLVALSLVHTTIAVVLTNSEYNVQFGVPFTLGWTDAAGPVTIELIGGADSSSLLSLQTLGTNVEGNAFTWTPGEIPGAAVYAFRVFDGSTADAISFAFSIQAAPPPQSTTPPPTATATTPPPSTSPTSTATRSTTTAPSNTKGTSTSASASSTASQSAAADSADQTPPPSDHGEEDRPKGSDALPLAAKIGIGVGAGVGFLVLALYCLYKMRQSDRREEQARLEKEETDLRNLEKGKAIAAARDTMMASPVHLLRVGTPTSTTGTNSAAGFYPAYVVEMNNLGHQRVGSMHSVVTFQQMHQHQQQHSRVGSSGTLHNQRSRSQLGSRGGPGPGQGQ
ncbi:hypothetical protein OQA88_2306 [Cercophora sp. LCS_1]